MIGAIIVSLVVTGVIGCSHYMLANAGELDKSYSYPEDETYRPKVNNK